MYSWPEFIDGKGSSEVVSCLEDFFCSLPKEVTTLYLYSDGCPGQNKNATVMQYLFTLVRLGRFKLIQHHFPVRGHSFLPNDRDFGRRESKKKRQERVYIPEQWHEVIRSARRRNPFTVTPITQDMVVDYTSELATFSKSLFNLGRSLWPYRRLEFSNTLILMHQRFG